MNKDPDLVLDPQHGIGLEWRHGKETYYTVLLANDVFEGNRVCRLKLSSYIGMDIEGIHYYAKLSPANPCVGVRGDPDVTVGGYMGKDAPTRQAMKLSSITVMRTLRAVEKDARGRALCKVGEETSKFNSLHAARAAAVKLFLKRFPPGWVLLEEDEFDTPAVRKALAISGDEP